MGGRPDSYGMVIAKYTFRLHRKTALRHSECGCVRQTAAGLDWEVQARTLTLSPPKARHRQHNTTQRNTTRNMEQHINHTSNPPTLLGSSKNVSVVVPPPYPLPPPQ
jgi:hypothetical protein